jgi:tubby-related protein 4
MYAYVELANVARTDCDIQSLSWMNYVPSPTTVHDANTISDADSTHLTTTRAVSDLLNTHKDGWLATGNTNHIVSVTFTSIRSDEQVSLPDRTNFNLRAHHSEVRLVSWNVPFQKLATVDEKGVIFVWVKHENRWSLELINDRNHSVIDMAWSHDGRVTVICYEDGYVLVGSVTGQRYWSTVVNIPQAKISAVTWMPDGSQ